MHYFQQVSSLESSDAESILDTRLENEKRYKGPLIYQPNPTQVNSAGALLY